MKPVPWNSQLPRHPLTWGLCGVLLIILIGFLRHPVDVFISDIWYHLTAARSILEHGFSLWDLSTFQPLGRPNLYPPLLPLLLAALSSSPDTLVHTAQIVGPIAYLIFLILFWSFCRRFWNEVIAGIALTLTLSSSMFFMSMTSLMPASLGMIFVLGSLWSFMEQRYWWSALALLALFYTHLTFPWLTLFTLILLAIHFPVHRRALRYMTLGVLLVFLPWGLHLLVSWKAFNTDMMWNHNPLFGFKVFAFLSHYYLNLILFPLSLYSIYSVRHEKNAGLVIVKSLLLGFLVMLPFYGGRYFWHVLPFFYLFIPIRFQGALAHWFSHTHPRQLVGYAGILLMLLIPLPMVQQETRWTMTTIEPDIPPLNFLLIPEAKNIDLGQIITLKNLNALTLWIEQHTTKDTILRVNQPYIAQYLTVMTGRPTDNGMFWEVSNNHTIDALERRRETDPNAVFVYADQALPNDVHVEQTFGGIKVGRRN